MLIPRMAALFGGAAVGVIAAVWKSMGVGAPERGRLPAVRPATGFDTGLAKGTPPTKAPVELAIPYTILKTQIDRLEDRVERHDQQLRAIPSSHQIGAAIDRVFERSAKVLDERFAEQARSIESLKTMVSQTDDLLEKVLDSIYSLPEMPRDPERERENRRLAQ